MTVGVIARMDRSGLAQQTRAIARLLPADVIVAIDMGHRARGPQTPIPGAVTLCPRDTCPDEPHAVDAGAAFEAFAGCDVVWTAETPYWPNLPIALAGIGTRTVVTANPELLRPTPHATTVLPTSWHAERLGLPVVPHPAPVGDIPVIAPPEVARRFLHVGAPAMRDRNGTDVVLRACELYRGPTIAVVLAGEGIAWVNIPHHSPNVILTTTAPVGDWQDLYTHGDVLLLPRRYGGLCLPALEAAAAGMSIVMTDLAPQSGWSGVDSCVSAAPGPMVPMAGGNFDVARPDPQSLADAMLAYASSPARMAAGARQASRWAASLAWPEVEPLWREVLG